MHTVDGKFVAYSADWGAILQLAAHTRIIYRFASLQMFFCFCFCSCFDSIFDPTRTCLCVYIYARTHTHATAWFENATQVRARVGITQHAGRITATVVYTGRFTIYVTQKIYIRPFLCSNQRRIRLTNIIRFLEKLIYDS